MKLKAIFLFGLLAIGFGCSEDDLTRLDPGRVVPENYFQNEQQIESAILSAYSTLRSGPLVSRWYFFINDLRDDHHLATSSLTVLLSIPGGNAAATDFEMTEHWTALYLLIHRANTALDGIEANTTVSEEVKATLAGEARFLRGWAYNELATQWGGVPIYTTRLTTLDGFQPRSTREEAFAQAQADLQFAAENLPETRSDATLGRATRGSALGILGRSYMQTDNLDQAKTALEAIVASNQYALVEDFGDLFVEENDFTTESLFEVVYAPIGDYNWNGFGTGDGSDSKSVRAQEYGKAWRNVAPTSDLVNLYENELAGCDYTDPRLRETVIFEGDTYANGTEVFDDARPNSPAIDYHGTNVNASFYKYEVYYKQDPGEFYTSTTNYILMRYADVLLLLAEIEARQGDLDAARGYVNQVRSRVGLPDLENSCVPNDDQQELITAIIDERGKELASESIRARDLRRWDRYGVIDAANYLEYWTDRELLLPIPLQEIVTNTEISQADQNPGYN
ncbi:putative outer membrane starch-binding protein [Neolewinella xylanilytica]|uniref:Putative outer membrane starch-binding protein n=1 Tax=Neolewinella xylanilytica TaxID=1514080 RepID=A0A2S6I1X0_9BACT|nr:RagB/SusD family nutrient uptake outer membrane protein [Neolewinella xylanilytica]PPK85079.1 putative outer membrane starch-binding protein [Neolewinella xylanilytica]